MSLFQLGSLDALYARHDLERVSSEAEIAEMLKKASKKEKRVFIARAQQMEYDLKARQRDEEDLLEDFLKNGGGEEEKGDSGVVISNTSKEIIALKTEIDDTEQAIQRAGLAKKEKAMRKKGKRAEKEACLKAEKDRIAAEAGNSARDIELSQIKAMLKGDGLAIKEIASDGNCLYRAVADQLAFVQQDKLKIQPMSFPQLRKLAAEYMRDHPDNFAPFIDSSLSYDKYCDEVERSIGEVVWGGQLEIKALCNVLKRDIVVYKAGAPVVHMTPDEELIYNSNQEKIKLTFHQHYFAMGAHYNSAVMEECTCGDSK